MTAEQPELGFPICRVLLRITHDSLQNDKIQSYGAKRQIIKVSATCSSCLFSVSLRNSHWHIGLSVRRNLIITIEQEFHCHVAAGPIWLQIEYLLPRIAISDRYIL